MIDWTRYRGVLFDLDGVLTPTAKVHEAAWKRTFDSVLRELRGEEAGEFTHRDYLTHVDGKPRYDGVRDFLISRGIVLVEGSPDDPPGVGTICGVGNRKNEEFRRVLAQEWVEPFPDAVVLIDHLDSVGVEKAVVSSSANAVAVLEAAGLAPRFGVVVEGREARRLDLPGKPAPAIFLEAAARLGLEPGEAVVVEDAVSGVEAGRRGGFGLVVGVSRHRSSEELERSGADLVVDRLDRLIP